MINLYSTDFRLFEWSLLHMIEYENYIAISAFKKNIHETENNLKEIKLSFDEKIKTDPAFQELSQKDIGSYYSNFYQDDSIIINQLVEIRRNSICFSLISFFETRLKFICQEIERENELTIFINDFKKGSTIEKYWKFLTEAYKISRRNLEDNLKLLIYYNRIRNKLIHHDGLVNSNFENTIPYINGISFQNADNENNQIKIKSPVFLTNLTELISTFLDKLLISIDDRYIILNKK